LSNKRPNSQKADVSKNQTGWLFGGELSMHSCVKDWLLLMDNERLHTALSSLKESDVEFLLELSKFSFNQSAFSRCHGVSQQAVSKRQKKLVKRFWSFSEKWL